MSAAFKIATDPFVGKLAFTRIYSGVMNVVLTFLTQQKVKRKIRDLLRYSNTREEVDALEAID